MDNKKRGQADLVGSLVGLMVGIIILIAVVLPVTTETISNASLTGTAKTIGDLFPTLLLVGGMMLIVSIFFVPR